MLRGRTVIVSHVAVSRLRTSTKSEMLVSDKSWKDEMYEGYLGFAIIYWLKLSTLYFDRAGLARLLHALVP